MAHCRLVGAMGALVLAITFLAASPGSAEIVTRCGSANGVSWYFAGVAVSRDDAGWHEDAIEDGELQLIVSGEEPDIIFTDATNRTRSARAEGGFVTFLGGAPDEYLVVLVAYPANATIEHYIFNVDGAGNGYVVWGTARAAGLIQKSSLMRSDCRAP